MRESQKEKQSSFATVRHRKPNLRRVAALLLALSFVFSACGAAAFAAELPTESITDVQEDSELAPAADAEPVDEPDLLPVDTQPYSPESEIADTISGLDGLDVPLAEEADEQVGEDEESTDAAPPEEALPGSENELPDVSGPITSAEDFLYAIATADTITLGADLEIADLTEPIRIASGRTVAVDLNAHSLRVSSDQTSSALSLPSLFDVEGSITLTDSSVAQTGYLVAANAENAFYVHGVNSAMQLSDCRLEIASSCGRGILCADGAQMTLEGDIDTAQPKTAELVNGGAVSLLGSGTAALFARGTVSNARGLDGGAVWVGPDAVFTMQDTAEIRGSGASNNGGAIAVEGTLRLYGGSITHNTAASGGGIWAGANASVEANAPQTNPVTITDNSADVEGGGILLTAPDKSSLLGYGSVINNTSSDQTSNLAPADVSTAETFDTGAADEPGDPDDGEDSGGSASEPPTPTDDSEEPSEGPSDTDDPEGTSGPADDEPSEGDEGEDKPAEGGITTLEELVSALTSGESAALGADIAIPGDSEDEFTGIMIPTDVTARLALNGHTISAQLGTGTALFEVLGSLTIADSGSGGITLSSGSSMVLLQAGGNLTIEDGTYTVGSGAERAVTVHPGAQFTMQGGTITGAGRAQSGGAVLLVADPSGSAGAKAVLTGGTISGTQAYYGGGVAVMNGASLSLRAGASIEDCNAVSGAARTTTGLGGGVYVDGGTFSLDGGAITGCSAAADGGGVYAQSGSVVLNGGTIEGCSADGNGGGLYAASAAMVSADAPQSDPLLITDNSAPNGEGGGMYFEDASKASLAGYARVDNNTAASGSNIAPPDAIPELDTFEVGSDIAGEAEILVSTFTELKKNLEAGNSVGLASNINAGTQTSGITITGQATLDLNGYTLTCSTPGVSLLDVRGSLTITNSRGSGSISYPSGDNIISVQSGATATLLSGTLTIGSNANRAAFVASGGTFKLSGGTVTGQGTAAGAGGAFLVAGTLEFTGGTISGTRAQRGGAVALTDGTLKMSGTARIEGCTTTAGEGGGVLLRDSGATAILSGGTITGCKAAGNGGGVYVGDGAKLITDATEDNPLYITDNSAKTDGGLGGGIYLVSGSTADLGGYAEILRNLPGGPDANLYPHASAPQSPNFRISDSESVDAYRDLVSLLEDTSQDYVKLTGDIIQTGIGGPDLDGSGNTIPVLTISRSVTLDLDGHTLDCAGVGTPVNLFELETASDAIVTVTNGTIRYSEGDNIFKVGNNCTLKITEDVDIEITPNVARAVIITSGGTLEMSGGTIHGRGLGVNPETNSALSGGAVNVASGTMRFTGGAITGTWATRGGAIAVTGSGTLTMSGSAQIQGTVAIKDGGAICVRDNASTFDMQGGTITECIAGTDGGAISVGAVWWTKQSDGTPGLDSAAGSTDPGGTATLGSARSDKAIEISKCSAAQTGRGGGIYVGEYGTLTTDAPSSAPLTIEGNSSGSGIPGGGIYIDEPSQANDKLNVRLVGYAYVKGNLPADVPFCNVYPQKYVQEAGPVFKVADNNGVPGDGQADTLLDYIKSEIEQGNTRIVINKTYVQSESLDLNPTNVGTDDPITLVFGAEGVIKGGSFTGGEGNKTLMSITDQLNVTLEGSGRVEGIFEGLDAVIDLNNATLILDGPTISGGTLSGDPNNPNNSGEGLAEEIQRGAQAIQGVRVQGGATFTMNSGTIENCGRTYIRNINTSDKNTVDGSAGGGLHVKGRDSSATINGGTFRNNAALKGGAAYVTESATLTIKDGSFIANGNARTDYGGAVTAEGYCKLDIYDGTFADNRARWGGAIAIVRPITNNPGDSNPATGSGDAPAASIQGGQIGTGRDPGEVQALAVDDIAEHVNGSMDQGNIATNGGGLFIDAGSRTVNITNTSIQSNSAANGGGIYILSGGVTLGDKTVVWRNGAVAGNSRPQDSDPADYAHQWLGNGGGINVQKGATLTLNGDAQVVRNATTGQRQQLASTWPADGGGIYTAGATTLNETSVVRGNFSMGRGGGIYVDATGSLSFGNHAWAEWGENEVLPEEEAVERRAVLYNRTTGTMDSFDPSESADARLIRNVDWSGRINPDTGEPTVTYGGMNDSFTSAIWDGPAPSNIQPDEWPKWVGAATNARQGGALWTAIKDLGASGTLDLRALIQLAETQYPGQLSPNDTSIDYGVPTLYVTGYAEVGGPPDEDGQSTNVQKITIDLNGCAISGDNLDLLGSAQNTIIRVYPGSTLTITDSQGTGMIVRRDAMLNSLIQVRPGATLSVQGGTMTNGGNHAIKSEGGDITITGNTKITGCGNGREPGGGVMVTDGSNAEQGKLTIHGNAEFCDNFGTLGGAIYSDGSGKTYIESDGVRIHDNEAHNGGGVWARDLVMNGGSIDRNLALWGGGRTGQGGGIFVSGTFVLTSGSITNNTARNAGGGVYVSWGTQALIDGKAPGAVKILDNVAEDSIYDSWNETHSFAGGGIFLEHNLKNQDELLPSERTVLRIYNAYITENRAAYAAGIGTCEWGSSAVLNVDGPTILNNELVSEVTLPLGNILASDQVKVSSADILCDGHGTIGVRMIGPDLESDPLADWQGLGIIGSRTYAGGTPQDINIDGDQAQDTLAQLQRFGIKNTTTDPNATSYAEQYATALIQGNYSRTGAGGIGGNGTLILGRGAVPTEDEDSSETSLTLLKKAQTATGSEYTMKKGDSFTFAFMSKTFQEGQNAEAWQSTPITAVCSENGSSVLLKLQDLVFTEAGLYSYIVKETGTNVPNMDIDEDSAYWIDVIVRDNAALGSVTEGVTGHENLPGSDSAGGGSALSTLEIAQVNVYSYVNGETTASGDPVRGQFIGSYTPDELAQENPLVFANTVNPTSQNANVDMAISKEAIGRTPATGEILTFVLTGSGEVPMPAGTMGNPATYQLVWNAANGTSASMQLGRITYTAPGTYSYVLREETPQNAGIACVPSPSAYTITVSVTRSGSGLRATVSSVNPQASATITGSSVVLGFRNTYDENGDQPGEAGAHPRVQKTVTGGTTNAAFTFTIQPMSSMAGAQGPAAGSVTIEGRNTPGTADFGPITFYPLGVNEQRTYVYEIRETHPEDAQGIVYDDTVWTYTAVVSETDGVVTFLGENYRSNSGGYANAAQFTNSVGGTGTPPPGPSGTPVVPPPPRVTPGVTPTPSPRPSSSPSASPSQSPSANPSQSPSASPSASATPSVSPSGTPNESETPEPSYSPGQTDNPTVPSGSPGPGESRWPTLISEVETPTPTPFSQNLGEGDEVTPTPFSQNLGEMEDVPTSTTVLWYGSTPTPYAVQQGYTPQTYDNTQPGVTQPVVSAPRTAPKTDDNRTFAAWMLMLAAAVCAAGAVICFKADRTARRAPSDRG